MNLTKYSGSWLGIRWKLSEVMTVLREKPRSAKEISEILGITPGEASNQLKRSARQDLLNLMKAKCVIVLHSKTTLL